MIPPLTDLRIRSILRWLQRTIPASQSQSEPSSALLKKAHSLDEQMMQAFDAKENALMDRMFRRADWGTEQATREYRTAMLQIWQDIVSEFLPVFSESEQQDAGAGTIDS